MTDAAPSPIRAHAARKRSGSMICAARRSLKQSGITPGHANRNNGNPTRHNVYVGDAVGLGVGLPILGLSAWLFADSQHKLNLLKRQRLSVSYSPDTHQPVLQLSFNY